VLAALATLPESLAQQAHLAFVAHSIPLPMELDSGPQGHAYTAQLAEAARLVAQAVGGEHPFSLSYCSRSGPPSVPWLEPDINDHLVALAADGVAAVVVVPIGFVSDHMEVVYDLDTEAAQTAAGLGLAFARSATVGADARFVAAIRSLALERMGQATPRALGGLGPAHDVCPEFCCRSRSGARG
jgi:ferrochelatase